MGNNLTIFQTAVAALGANSQSLSVVSNNIANINTPGYSRQTVSLEAVAPQTSGGIELGRGVKVGNINRIFDSFAELRVRDAVSAEAQEVANAETLQQVEALFNEVSNEGLASFVSDFFNAFHEVANDPTSTTTRVNLLARAEIMADRFNSLATKLDEARTFIDGDIANSVSTINSLTTEIADLNLKIQSAAEGGDLSLQDQRNLKVKDLAELIDVSTVETTDGVFQVYTGNGLQIINGTTTATIGTATNVNNDNLKDITFTVGNGSATTITSQISDGALKGYINVRDTLIPSYQNKIDELAYEITTEVNNIHKDGFSLDSNNLIEFFDESVLTDAAAASTSLATDLRNTSNTNLNIRAGDSIAITGTASGAISGTLTVTTTTTVADIASWMQTRIRAASGGTETVAYQAGGTIRVTSDAVNITSLELDITGKTNFNTAFTYTTPINSGGSTADSASLEVANKTNAANVITLDSAVDGTPRAIAASDTSAKLPGSNVNALALAALQTTNISFENSTETFISFYGNLLADIGSDTESHLNKAEFSETVLRQAEIQREKVSGVSLEEEQLELVRFQAAFQAASRLVGIADEILETLSSLI